MIKLLLFLTFAYIPTGAIAVYNYDPILGEYFQHSYSLDVEYILQYKNIISENNVYINMWYSPDQYHFWPNQVVFKNGIAYKYKNMSIGFNHTCYHPISPYGEYLRRADLQIIPAWEGGYTEIYIKVGTQ